MAHRISVIAGDGIGPEVTREALGVLRAAAEVHGFEVDLTEHPYGTEHYLATGEMLPDEALATMAEGDAIFLGAIGDPRVETGMIERAIIMGIRVGLDLYTRFLWRGVSFGEQWTLQPTASFAAYGLSVDLWASAAPDQSSLVDYVGITLGYTYEASFGTFAVTLADWIFTQRYTAEGTVETGAPYLFDFDGNGNGSHWLDLTLAYTGPSAFPLTVEFGVVVYNDPDHSLYAGLRYDIDVGAGFTLTPEFGVVFGRSARWYLTDADPINVTNCALTLSRTVALGHGITLPLSIALVVNPESERVHIVAGVGVHL